MKREKLRAKMSSIVIVDIEGIEFDEILGYTADEEMVTIKYTLNGHERVVSMETGGIEIEFTANV